LDHAKNQLAHVLRVGDFEKAGQLKYVELPKLEKDANELAESMSTQNAFLSDVITDEHVAKVVSEKTSLIFCNCLLSQLCSFLFVCADIPLSRLLQGEREKLLSLEDILKKRVIGMFVFKYFFFLFHLCNFLDVSSPPGQDRAIEAIANAVRIARAGLHPHTKPVGSFLFLGPSGVGKTELAKTLADFMFNDENAMVRVDMSEYMEVPILFFLLLLIPSFQPFSLLFVCLFRNTPSLE
jgi:ATP-dependent Clp protease ATP-binding subunit ClpB